MLNFFLSSGDISFNEKVSVGFKAGSRRYLRMSASLLSSSSRLLIRSCCDRSSSIFSACLLVRLSRRTRLLSASIACCLKKALCCLYLYLRQQYASLIARSLCYCSLYSPHTCVICLRWTSSMRLALSCCQCLRPRYPLHRF